MKRSLFLLLALAGVSACTDTVLFEPDMAVYPETATVQAPVEQGLAVKMVPFAMKGNWWSGDTGAPELCTGIEGAFPSYPTWDGQATHMGEVTGMATNCLSIQDDGSYYIHLQSAAIVAANGDILYAHGTAVGDGTQFILHPDMSFEIFPVPFVGGTGRFENATGYYHLYGDDLAGGSFTATGLISSVGSSR